MAINPLVHWRQSLLAITLVLFASLAQATIEAMEFRDEGLRERYQHLAFILRCPKCQNQNIIDSDAPIAADLRKQVHRLLHEGYPDDQIIDFMVARYGNFVLYEPPVNSLTYLLWYGPAVLVVIGAIVVILLLRGRKNSTGKQESDISEADRERLNNLLKDKRN
ncbi:cytochrome c-type biogenesis protein [Oceanospirillum sediminis]|uniref:Cytochrome c-type biogenesis protein n=1 Tax=Oceanospirillum sediminis TaxID=2760088 RepID=A0A839IL57_9GAMM|nr:cytochrome c-type biogenesis protein [Oceanospirillum sediminis]MBB1485688.1 cytochrome c-type biogenesis protein CcmH [Oceanospirillum sediminis]